MPNALFLILAAQVWLCFIARFAHSPVLLLKRIPKSPRVSAELFVRRQIGPEPAIPPRFEERNDLGRRIEHDDACAEALYVVDLVALQIPPALIMNEIKERILIMCVVEGRVWREQGVAVVKHVQVAGGAYLTRSEYAECLHPNRAPGCEVTCCTHTRLS